MLFKNITVIDDLLNRIGDKLQLNQSRREKAEKSYEAVSEWLMKDEIFFSNYDINIYPQGSYRLGTTVKPKIKDVYDLDFVLEVNTKPSELTPVELLNHLERRLKESDLYKNKVVRKKRCMCIEYEDEFHLDIIPALPAQYFKGEHLRISDRRLKEWLDSCPKGYINWFESKYISQQIMLKKSLEIEELPEKLPYQLIQPLQRIVQLMKRHRDIYFEKAADNSPRSIVLTTLAAMFYKASESENDSLMNVLENIKKEIDTNPFGKIEIVNPSNPNEKFSDLWDTKPHLYKYFKDFIKSFYSDWKQLNQLEGMAYTRKQLEKMFGETISREAIEEHAEYTNKLRKSGLLGINLAGTLISSGEKKSIPVQKNIFYGD